MITVKPRIEFDDPVEITMSPFEARKLYATLSLVTKEGDKHFPDTNREQAMQLLEALNKVLM